MIAICIESSHAKGLGHLFRGIHLARCLARHHRRHIILVNRHPPSIRLLEASGLPFMIVPLNAAQEWEPSVITELGIDLWINDRLDTSRRHAERVKACGVALATFDDAGNGAALSDLHIAPLAGFRRAPLTGERLLTDLRYLILDPALSPYRRPREKMNRLLVTLGGSDTHAVVITVVDMLTRLGWGATIHSGPGSKYGDDLKRRLGKAFTLASSVPSMGALYWEHDLAITGGGITPFEAAATGLPTVVIANEPFEIPTGTFLAAKGAACFAGHHARLTFDGLDNALAAAGERLCAMSACGLSTIPQDGVENVYHAICRYL